MGRSMMNFGGSRNEDINKSIMKECFVALLAMSFGATLITLLLTVV